MEPNEPVDQEYLDDDGELDDESGEFSDELDGVPAEASAALDLSMGSLIIFGVLLTIGLLFGTLIYLKTALPTFILAMLLSTGLPRIFSRWKLMNLHGTGILFVIIAAIHIAGVFVVYPLWTLDRRQFGEGILAVGQKIDHLGGLVQDELLDAEKAPVPTAGEETLAPALVQGAGESREDVSGGATRLASKLVDGLNHATSLAIWQRLAVLCQLLSFSAFFLFLPIFIRTAAPGASGQPAAESPGFGTRFGAFWLSGLHKIGGFSLVRMVKALLMGAVTAGGFIVGGISGWWFVALIVAFVASFSNLGPMLAAVIGLVLVLGSDSLLRGLIAIAVICLVLAIVEKKLHWYLHLVPKSKRYNLPPEMLAPSAAGNSKMMALFGGVLKLVPSAIMLVAIAVIAFVLYQFFMIQQATTEREKHLRDAQTALKQERAEDAAALLDGLLARNPHDQEAIFGMLQVRLQEGKFNEAFDLAEQIEKWKAPEPGASTITGKLRVRITEFIDAAPQQQIREGRGYEAMLEKIAFIAEQQRYLPRLAERLERLQPNSLWPIYARALVHYHDREYRDAINGAEQGLYVDAENESLLLLKAMALFELEEYRECLEICRKVLQLSSNNREARALRDKAGLHLSDE